jgi:hypothetical protein
MLAVILILNSLVRIGMPALTRIYLSPVSYSVISVQVFLWHIYVLTRLRDARNLDSIPGRNNRFFSSPNLPDLLWELSQPPVQ